MSRIFGEARGISLQKAFQSIAEMDDSNLGFIATVLRDNISEEFEDDMYLYNFLDMIIKKEAQK